MRSRTGRVPAAGVLAVAALAAGLAQASDPKPHPRPMVIIGGMLIDGSGEPPRPNDALVIVDGRIKAMGLDAQKRAPKDARLIVATDAWILPGLIDSHVHFFQTGGLDARPDFVPDPQGRPYPAIVEGIRRNPQPYLRAYICAGVTSVVDFGGPMWGFDMRDGRVDDPLSPRLAFTGPLLATYDPKALELGDDDPIWLMKDATGVRAQVDRLAAHGPDLVKIWFVHRPGDDLAAQAALVREAIAAAHAKRLRAAVHATALETARLAVEAGADVLVHSVDDAEVDDAFVAAVVARKVIVIPTLMVARGYREVQQRKVAFEPIEEQCAPPKTIESFTRLSDIPEDVLPGPRGVRPDSVPTQQRNLKRLADAGAIVAAGTDAGNTRTLHGPSLHREFVLMAEAGLSPSQILVAATRNGARVMGREHDLGQLRPGFAADVLLLDADPLADIRNTRRIRTVIKDGAPYQP